MYPHSDGPPAVTPPVQQPHQHACCLEAAAAAAGAGAEHGGKCFGWLGSEAGGKRPEQE